MNPRILLVEDNPSDIELVKTAFSEANILADYTIFRDGDEAIIGIESIARSGPLPQLVLLDLSLPRTSGHEVLRRLRSLPPFGKVPVVVFSTSNHPTDRATCMASGADGYLVKPPHFADLLLLVGELRDHWLLTRQ